MPYDDQNEYNKYQAGCDCDDKDSCGCSANDCSCCPTGTVGVYNEEGEHVGCLTPNDAAKYGNDAHIPAENYVKVYDPTTGEYLGDLPTAEAIKYLDFLINGTTGSPVQETFNVVNPEVGPTNFFEINKPLIDGITDDIDLVIDRVGITDAVIVSIVNSVEDIQFDPSGTVDTIPINDSDKTVKFTWTGIAAPGTYTFILRFSTTNVVKEVPIRLTLT